MIDKRIYKFGKSTLILEFGNIIKSTAQVLVSSDDYYLTMGGGVSLSILKAGGNAIALDAAKKAPAVLGDVVVTTAGHLPAQYIFHAITIGPNGEEISHAEIVLKTTRKCMELLDTLQLSSIAFPAIGSGAAGFSLEEVAAEMAGVIADDLNKRQRAIEVTIYLFDRFGSRNPIDYLSFFEKFASRTPRIERHKIIEEDSPLLKDEAVPEKVISQTADEIKYQRLNNLRKLLGSLEDQRYRIEAQLIDALNDPQKEAEIKTLREKLRENEELRLSYYTELKLISDKDAKNLQQSNSNRKPKTVFVSSTFQDLAAHRVAVKDQIARRDMFFRGMEHFGAIPSNLPPAMKIIEEVRNADVYLGILGVRYGSIDQATGLSMTELEFNEAESSGKSMLLYIISDDAPVKVSDIEPNPDGKVKLDTLKNRILKRYTVYLFHTIEDLSRQAYEDLGKL